MPEFAEYLAAVVAGSAVAVALLVLAATLFGRRRQTARQLLVEVQDRAAFLFDGEDLIDATPSARRLLGQAARTGSDWDRVCSVLRPTFPELPSQMAGLADRQCISLREEGGALALEAEHWDGLVRIVLVPATDQASDQVDTVAIAAMEDELETLRTLAEDAPQLIWKLDPSGDITWANRAYLDLAMSSGGTANGELPTWPPRHIFDQIRAAPLHGEPTRRRVPLSGVVEKESEVAWYEVTSLRRGTESVHFAVDANGVVRAERAQREFVQTLTKTFADLSTGLMIFDRRRRLVLFNPAFLDMTDLPIEFLSARPVIHSVLDRMRESRILPEPKDYSSWRDQMAALENAAKDGTYCESWVLPSGQTFRVTGRPHPDGAIAFLFEDITAEVSLTRRFRSELEFGQSVIDNIEEAVVVFSASGTQVAANRHYCRMWNVPMPQDQLTDLDLKDSLARWREATVPTPAWGDVRDFALDRRDRAEWSETVQMTDGRTVACRFVPLAGGATMAAFRHVDRARGQGSVDDRPLLGLARHG